MKKSKKIITMLLMIMVMSSLCVCRTYAGTAAKRAIYQGYFMRGNTFISVALYTSYEGKAIGVAYSIDRPRREEMVTANVKEYLGEIYKINGNYYVKNGKQNMKLDFYKKKLSVSQNSSYKGNYIQVSNQGANMPQQDVWLKIPQIHLDVDEVTLFEKMTLTLRLRNYPENERILWKSDNPSVASVSNKGKIKAKKAGTAIITAKAGGEKYTCKVTVEKARVILSRSSATMKVKEKLQLYAIAPGKVVWKSSDNKIASVSQNGKVEAKKTGTVVITVKYKNTTEQCKIEVKEADRHKFKKYRGKAYCKSNSKYRYGVSFKKKNDMIYVGIWNSSGTSSSYEDFYFKLDRKKTKYIAEGMRSKKQYEISLIPKGKKIQLKLKCKDKQYTYFNTKGINLGYDKKVTDEYNY